MVDKEYLGWFASRLEDATKQDLDNGHREADDILVETLEYLDNEGVGDGALKEIVHAYLGVRRYFG